MRDRHNHDTPEEAQIKGRKENELRLAQRCDALVKACERGIVTIATMDAFLVRDRAAYVTMAQGTTAQMRAAIAGEEEKA